MPARDADVWPGILRGYGPLAVIAALLMLMSVLVPSKAPKTVQTIAGANGSVGPPVTGVTSGDTVPSGPGSAPAAASRSGGPATASRQTGTAQSPATACSGKAQQVPGDPYSPACLAWGGANGGATWKGVTGTEIHIAARYTPADAGYQQSVAQIAGAHLTDTQADVDRTISALAQYFNTHFQFYGRHLVVDFYNGVGSAMQETLGNGQAEAEADAVTVGEKIKAFADITASTELYADDLVREGVMAFGDPYMSSKWHAAHAPYAWSLAPDGTKIATLAATYYLKRLAGNPAIYAGGSLKGKPRKLAIIAPENSWYQDSAAVAHAIVASGGYDSGSNLTYELNLTTLSTQANTLIPKLQSQGVTTLMCLCDPILPVFLSGVASRAGYFPEFYITGTALTDVDLVGQLWSQDFADHAFGISTLQQLGPQTDSIGYEAYKQVRPDEPAAAVQIIYYQMYMLALGIQLAGPNLNPQTFATGMFSYPAHLGPDGLWQYSAQNYTASNDAREIYWEPDQISPFDLKAGRYVDPNPGRRYTTTSFPTGQVSYPGFPNASAGN